MIPLAPIIKTVTVKCTPNKAFEIFTYMGAWWPLDKRAMSPMTGKVEAKRLQVDAKLGGQIIEIAGDDSEILWGTFRKWTPGAFLQMDFHMGLPADQTGQVDVVFDAEGTGTKVTLTHHNWEGYGEDMAEMMTKGYGDSWDLLFGEHYAQACG